MLIPLLQNIQQASAAAATVSGDTLTEADVVAGGKELVITLTDDTWLAATATLGNTIKLWKGAVQPAEVSSSGNEIKLWKGAVEPTYPRTVFDDIRQDIIDGLDSAQAELHGWNNDVRDVMAVTTVVRTSDTVVTITLPATAGYNISANEIITITVPASAVTLGVEIPAQPTQTIQFIAVNAGGGGWAAQNFYDGYRQKRGLRRGDRAKTSDELKRLKGIDREIADALHRKLEYEARTKEIQELNDMIVSSYTPRQQDLADEYSDIVGSAYKRAVEKGTFSAVEAFEREMEKAKEDEEFLLLVMMMLE